MTPLYVLRGAEISDLTVRFSFLRKSYSSLISLGVPTMLVPWALQITKGFPYHAINLHNIVMKVAVVSSDTGSKCSALTVNDL